jgi:hypothetical protein
MLITSTPSGPHGSRRSALVGVLALAGATAVAACHSSSPSTTATTSSGEVASGGSSSIVSSLTSAVPGMSSSQATLGAGSLLGLAQAKMPTDQFSQVASAIPGTSSLIGTAQKAGLPAASSLTSLSSITPLLSKAGITPTMVSQLTPALGSIIGAKGGPDLASSFLSAVK